MSTQQKSCPYCGSVMVGAYFVIGGGVWCCEDKDFMEHYVAGDGFHALCNYERQ